MASPRISDQQRAACQHEFMGEQIKSERQRALEDRRAATGIVSIWTAPSGGCCRPRSIPKADGGMPKEGPSGAGRTPW